MKRILVVCSLFAATIAVSQEFESIVRENCKTNLLNTWEGNFAVGEVAPLLTNDLYVSTFTNANSEGMLVEIYSCCSNGLARVFRSETNIKGVTPVLLKIGIATNSPCFTLWGLWRHPGNGGNKRYELYACTNSVFRVLSTYEYLETDNGSSWFCVDSHGEPISKTNLVFSLNSALWTNRTTKYKECAP